MHFSLPNTLRITLLSKTLPAARASRLRVAWFILGVAFGIGCSMAFAPISLPRMMTAETSAVSETPLANNEEQTPPQDTAETAATTPETTAPEVPALVPVVSPTAAAPTYPRTQELVATTGDTFVTLLGKAGVSTQEAHAVLGAMGKKFNPRTLDVRDTYVVTLDRPEGADSPIITRLHVPVSRMSSLEVERNDKGNYTVKQVDVPIVKKLARAGGKIDSSLYETIVGSGMPSSMVNEIIKAYSYDVDFQREIHEGDTVDVVFEQMQTEEGKAVGYGNIIYAALDLGDRNLRIYRYTDKQGNSDYYNARGESVRKALLRTPINGARITSGFGMRNHPIMGYSKMHKGVDFAASIGTPVYAAGDGVVSFVGRKGGYGNYLQIKHNNQYDSAYAHLSRFATGVAPGKKVKQGQIVAYVGTTGMSTGPHLHYEIHSRGTQVNPANVKFKTGTQLAGVELKSFKHSVGTLHAQLDNMKKPSGKVAMLDIAVDKSM